jgi:hypothetical protein
MDPEDAKEADGSALQVEAQHGVGLRIEGSTSPHRPVHDADGDELSSATYTAASLKNVGGAHTGVAREEKEIAVALFSLRQGRYAGIVLLAA